MERWFNYFMNNNKLINSILFFSLIISLAANIYMSTSHKNYMGNIIGTYLHGEEKDNGEYLTFLKDETYIHYKQFNVLDKGGYFKDYDNIYFLKNDEQLNEVQIIFIEDTVYYINADNTIKIYKKITDTPMLININNNQ